jgi:transcription initiation factor TFIIB
VVNPVTREIFCGDCGLIVKETIIDVSQEWRAFDHEQMAARARAGAPLTFTKHDKGLTTEIGKGLGELYKVPPKKRAQYYRIVKWHKRLIRSKDRNLSFAFSELQRIVSFLGLPRSVHERVARYYEEAVNRGLVRGRSIEAMVAALTYAVCRMFHTPRTFDEIAEASGINKREIGRTYRYIARHLNIRIIPANPIDFVPRFCSYLRLSDRVQAKAIQILKEAEKKEVTAGKGPTGVAAAAIYIASVLCGERRTQREVSAVAGITEVTIRTRYLEIARAIGLEKEIEEMERV